MTKLYEWASRALGHDTVLIVTEGIGVTPFLSMPSSIHECVANSPLSDSPFSLKLVEFHWYCRNEGVNRGHE